MQKEKKEKYHNFCQQAKLPILVQAWYLDAVCQSGEWDFVSVEEKGEIVGVLPFFIKKKYGFSYITMPLVVKYMGPFLIPEKNNLADQHLIYQELIEQLPEVHSFRQNFYPTVTNWLPFYWKNFEQTTLYTYHINIEAPENIYNNLPKKTRYRIRKAQKTLEIRENLSPEHFHHIHQMSFDRQGLKAPLSEKKFLAYDKVLAQHNARKMFFAIDNAGNPHAALYILLDKEVAFMQFLGSNPAFTKSEAVNLLHWHAMQYLSKEKNIKTIDYQGGMIKNIENIFRRFRAQQIPYFSIKKDNSKFFKLIESIKNK